MAEKKMWIAEATKNKGKLHEKLHVKKGEKIPESKIKKAEHSKSPKLRKEASLSETLKHMKKKK